jgi:hypothetical protein
MASALALTQRWPSSRQTPRSAQGKSEKTDPARVWQHLAAEYASSPACEEAALYRAAGATDVGIAYGADSSPRALTSSGGAMALLAWQK